MKLLSIISVIFMICSCSSISNRKIAAVSIEDGNFVTDQSIEHYQNIVLISDIALASDNPMTFLKSRKNCTGILIDESRVLTAAHCILGLSEDSKSFAFDKNGKLKIDRNHFVSDGVTNFLENVESIKSEDQLYNNLVTRNFIEIDSVILHPGLEKITEKNFKIKEFAKSDLAIINLSEKSTNFSNAPIFNFIQQPSKSRATLTLAGYGNFGRSIKKYNALKLLKFGKASVRFPRKTSTPVICLKEDKDSAKVRTGDSGGAIFDQDGKVIGIVGALKYFPLLKAKFCYLNLAAEVHKNFLDSNNIKY